MGQWSGYISGRLGNAYVAGNTYSSDFPTTSGAFDTSYNGNGDAFVTQLNSIDRALFTQPSLGEVSRIPGKNSCGCLR